MRRLLLGLLILMVLIGGTGCEGDTVNDTANATLSTLQISPDKETVNGGGQVKLTAIGEDMNGNSMLVEPEWSIVEGSGTLDSKTGSIVTFYAEAYNTGEVTVRALYDNIQDEITIGVDHLLEGSPDDYLFPTPNNLSDDPIPKTNSIFINTGEPVDNYNLMVPGYWVDNFGKEQNIFDNFPVSYVLSGDLDTPHPFLDMGWFVENQPHSYYHVDINLFPNEILQPVDPELFGGHDELLKPMIQIPRISKKRYYILLEHHVLTSGDLIDKGISNSLGTESTKTIEFAQSTTAEVSASVGWEFASASASLSKTVSTKTADTVSIKEERTETRDIWYVNDTGEDVIIGIYQIVDVYYLSDDEGKSLSESEHFQTWNIDGINLTQEIHIKTDERRHKEWRESEL